MLAGTPASACTRSHLEPGSELRSCRTPVCPRSWWACCCGAWRHHAVGPCSCSTSSVVARKCEPDNLQLQFQYEAVQFQFTASEEVVGSQELARSPAETRDC